MIARILLLGLFASAAHAGALSAAVSGGAVEGDVVTLNGVEARSSGGFVVYQHGVWTPRSVPFSAAPLDVAPTGGFSSAVVNGGPPDQSLGCAALAPSPRRGLPAITAASRAAYWPLVRDAECRHALPPGLLDAVVFQESRYRPFAVSPAGAGGLTQLMPRTASDLGVANRFEPAANIDGGARYLRSMLDHYRSVPLAVAAYNAGRRSVDRSGGIPLNRETPGYVRKVLGFFNAGDAGSAGSPILAAPAIAKAVSLTFDGAAQQAPQP